MGLFNFWKKSGKKVAGGGDAAPSAEALKKEVADLGLDTKGAEITVDGDKVTVSGGTLSAEEREKVILAVGNVEDMLKGNPDKPEYSFEKLAGEAGITMIPLPDPLTLEYP
ncbi:MAG TPA: hypothetical protein VLA45_06455, partial [Paracoccaceae bacterium]|nr:hypothetical protein [Paracoccaceae bacterium]